MLLQGLVAQWLDNDPALVRSLFAGLEKAKPGSTALVATALGAGNAMRVLDLTEANEDIRREAARLALWPQQRHNVERGIDPTVVDGNPPASYTRHVLDRVAEIGKNYRVRVGIAVPPELLVSDAGRQMLDAKLDAIEGYVPGGSLEIRAVEGELVIVSLAHADTRPSANAARAYWLCEELEGSGTAIPADVYAAVAAKDPELLAGTVGVLSFLVEHTDQLRARAISEIQFGDRDDVHDVKLGVQVAMGDAEESTKSEKSKKSNKVDVETRVLTLNIGKWAARFGDPKRLAKASTDLHSTILEQPQPSRLLVGPNASVTNGELGLGAMVAVQTGKGPRLTASINTTTGGFVGVQHNVAKKDVVVSTSAGAGLADGSPNALPGIHLGGSVTVNLLGEPSDDTYAYARVHMLLGRSVNGGVTVYGRHRFGNQEVSGFAQARMLDMMMGGPFLRAQLEFFKNSKFHAGVAVDTKLLASLMVGYGKWKLRLGMGGAVAYDDKIEVGVRLVAGVPIPYASLLPALNPDFRYMVVDGEVKITEIDTNDPKSLSNIHPLVLAQALDDMLARDGCSVDPTEIGPGDDPMDFLIREYLSGRGERINEPTTGELRRYFKAHQQEFASAETEELEFDTADKRQAALAKLQAAGATAGKWEVDEYDEPIFDLSGAQIGSEKKFTLVRVVSVTTPDFDDLDADIRGRIANEVRCEQERQLFNREFNRYLAQNQGLLEQGARIYRGLELSNSQNSQWKAVAKAKGAHRIEGPITESKKALTSRIKTTQDGMGALNTELGLLATSFEKAELGDDPGMRRLVKDATKEIERWQRRLQSVHQDYARLFDNVGGASQREALERVEKKRQKVNADLSLLVDGFIGAESLLEEILFDMRERQEKKSKEHGPEQIATREKLENLLGELKLSPTTLVLSSFVLAPNTTDLRQKELVDGFALEGLVNGAPDGTDVDVDVKEPDPTVHR